MRLYIYIAAVALILSGLTGLYWSGYFRGKESAEVNQLRAAVIAEKQRREIDNGVKISDSYALCLELGGLPNDCSPLRWMDAQPEDQ